MVRRNGFDKYTSYLKRIGLDTNWVISMIALAAQEVALRKKLYEMSITSTEEDFQKLAELLEETYKSRKQQMPLIILSICRAHRHIRAKLLHEGHSYRVSLREMQEIASNTDALVKELFPTAREGLPFINSIRNSQEVEIQTMAHRMVPEETRQALRKILDEISLFSEWSGSEDKLVYFVRILIRDREPNERITLFKILIAWYFTTTATIAKSRIAPVIAELTKSEPLRKVIFREGDAERLLSDFVRSDSWDMAGINAEIVASIAPDLDERQLKKILDNILLNGQIRYSWRAGPHILTILNIAERRLGRTVIKPIRESLSKATT